MFFGCDLSNSLNCNNYDSLRFRTYLRGCSIKVETLSGSFIPDACLFSSYNGATSIAFSGPSFNDSGHELFQSIRCSLLSYNYNSSGTNYYMDSPAAGLTIKVASTATFPSNLAGYGAATYGIDIKEGATVVYSVLPTLTGTLGNVILNKVNETALAKFYWLDCPSSGVLPRDIQWTKRTTWYVDGYAGDDSNFGDIIGSPLKTADEIQRRWGVDPIIQNSSIINFLTAPSNNLVNLNVGRENINYNITLQGPANTILVTSTLASYTTPITTNNEVTIITITGVSDFTLYVNKKVNFGAQGISRICAVNPSGLGNNYARITIPKTYNISSFPAGNTGTPTVSQAVTIENIGLDIGNININTFGQYDVLTVSPYAKPFIILKNLTTTSNSVNLSSNDYRRMAYCASFHIYNCDFQDLNSQNWNADVFGGSISIVGQNRINSILYGTLIRQATGNSGYVAVPKAFPGTVSLSDCVFENISLLVYDAALILSNIASFDCTYGMQIHNGGNIYLTGYLLGKNNSTYGLIVSSNGTLINASATLKITGTTSDWKGSSTNFTWANTTARKFASGSGTTTLVGGTVAISIEALPADAVVVATHKTVINSPGLLYVSTQSTTGFTITSTSNTDASVINWSWSSPSAGIGGIVNS